MFSIPKEYGVEYGFNTCCGYMETKCPINFNYLIFIAYYIIICNDISECTYPLLSCMQGGSMSVLVKGGSVGNRYLDWFRQAEADLRHAGNALDDGDFEWSCFAAHQAAEKAMKAVLQKFGMDAWGHTLTALVGHLPSIDSAPAGVVNCAKILDKHYIPTRYPNGFDSGAPTDFYTEEEAQKAIQCAEAIIEFCRNQIS